MNPLGLIFSFLYPFIFVDTKAEEIQFKKQVQTMMISLVGVTALWLILTIMTFFENESQDSQGLLSTEAEPKKIPEMISQIKILLKDKAYLGMLLACSIAFGSFGGFGISVNFLLSVWDYDEVG